MTQPITPIALDKQTKEWLEDLVKAQKASIALRWRLIALVVATATVISATFQVLNYCLC